MPTKEQLESALRNAHKAGDTKAAKRLANAIKEQRPGMLARAGSAIKESFMGGPSGDYSESLTLPSDPQEMQLEIDRARQSMPDSPMAGAQLGQDEHGNPTVTMGGKTQLLNRPGFSAKDVVDLPGNVMRGAEKIAPYLAGGAAAAPLKWAAGIPASGAIGAATNAADQGIQMAGGDRESFDPWEMLKTGAFMMGGDAAGRLVVGSLAQLASRAKPGIQVVDDSGALTDDAIDALRQVEAGQLDDYLSKELTKGNILSPEQAKRFNMFKKAGMKPTRANVTQNVDDWKFQQESMKSGGPVREMVDEQNQAMFGLMDDAATRTGGKTGDAYATGSSVSDFVTDNAIKLDKNISNLYKQADELANGRNVVDLTKLSRTLAQKGGDNQLSGGVVGSVRSMLKQRGLGARPPSATTRINKNPNRRINAREAEAVRKELNSIYEAANPRGRQILKELKDALDEDVFTAVGDDFYNTARSAKAKFEKELMPERMSKFDKNQKSVVKDILEGKIQPDDVFKRSVISGKVKDLELTKRYLGSQKGGQQAWKDLKGETIRHLQQKATIGQTADDATFSGTRFRKELDKIGNAKLKVLFSDDELSQLGTISRLGELRIADPAVGTGMGPSAQAIQQLADETPGVGTLVKWLRRAGNISETSRAANPAGGTIKALEKLPRRQAANQLSPLIGASSGSASQLSR